MKKRKPYYLVLVLITLILSVTIYMYFGKDSSEKKLDEQEVKMYLLEASLNLNQTLKS